VIIVLRAPSWLTVQDLGWTGSRSIGMPGGGAMDRQALAVANLLAGNPPGAAGLEWALGPGAIRFENGGAFALAGTPVEATLGGEPVPMLTTIRAEPRQELVISRQGAGRFTYLACRGGIEVLPVLGSRSTYVRGGFGGHHGRRLRNEDFLETGPAGGAVPPAGFKVPRGLAPDYDSAPLRVMPGPEEGLFDPAVIESLLGSEWIVSAASDRMGYRLKGPVVAPRVPTTRASEPACPGAVQVSDEGGPIVLMADGPTVGGYPKPAVVAGADLGRLAQLEPGSNVTFAPITVMEAQRIHRRRAIQLHTLSSLLNDASGS
jgi:biotin-dependent carboxylase-like uncharacterized protein